MYALFLWCYFFLVWFQPPWQMGSGWAVVIKSQLKGCRWVCSTDTSTRLYIHSLLNVKPQFGRTCLVWFSSFAENCSHCCHVSDAVLYYECQDEIHKNSTVTPQIRFWSCISFQIAGVCIWQNFVTGFMFGWGKQLKPWVQMTLTGNKSPGICISHESFKTSFTL